jgi:hypothetical protein
LAATFSSSSEPDAQAACCVCGGGDPNGANRPTLSAFTASEANGIKLYFSQPVIENGVGVDVSKIHLGRSKRYDYSNKLVSFWLFSFSFFFFLRNICCELLLTN